MPSASPGNLLEPSAAILIAAASGRALAAAARRAGFRPFVADFFGDLDTCEMAAAHLLVENGLEAGFRPETLVPVLESLAEGEAPVGLVYGAGFEDRTELLEAIARRWPLLGNKPEVVRRVKDPAALASLCDELSIPHPEISSKPPQDPENWLAKGIGGAGGTHIVPAAERRVCDAATYFQRIAAGEAVSLLFLGNGKDAAMIGASRQWPMPTRNEPFRWGGCLRPADLPPGLLHALETVAGKLVEAFALVGLNSIDFLVEGTTFTLIEINPRPGATLDIFDDEGSLFSAHVAACHGRLPKEAPRFDGAAAAAIAYAPRAIAVMPVLDWPDWTADRQRPQTRLAANDPLCTVEARASLPALARALVDARRQLIADMIDMHMREEFST